LIQIKTSSIDNHPEPACCDAKPSGILHLAVSRGTQPFQGGDASFFAMRVQRIALRAIREHRAASVGVMKNR
jgi:hypothetical protein